MSPKPESLSVQQVASLCGVNRNTVGYWCRSGKIHTQREGNKYVIPVKDLTLFLESTGRRVPQELYQENPMERVFKTVMACWEYNEGTPHGNECKDCRIFHNRLSNCFIMRGLSASKCPQDCNKCEYFHKTHLPRIQMVHQIAAPAFVYGDFHFLGGNSAGAELCGIHVEEIIGMGVEELVHRDSLASLLHEFRKMGLKGHEPSGPFPIYLKNRNQERIEVEALFYPLHEPEGAWLVLASKRERKEESPAGIP